MLRFTISWNNLTAEFMNSISFSKLALIQCIQCFKGAKNIVEYVDLMQSKAFYKTDGQTLKLTEMKSQFGESSKNIGRSPSKKASNLLQLNCYRCFTLLWHARTRGVPCQGCQVRKNLKYQIRPKPVSKKPYSHKGYFP